MKGRQIIPRQWIVVTREEQAPSRAGRNLPRGSAMLLLGSPTPREQRALRRLALARNLTIVVEGRGTAARVHNLRELTRARLRRTPLVLISPIHPTSSHPGWKPLPRMRAAALARLAERQAIALGGMNQIRHARVASLGFIAWAGISAFRT